MPEDATKNYKSDVITLPLFLKKQFLEFGFFNQPSNYLVFGYGLEPGRKMISERTFNKRHKTVLKNLEKEKKIDSMVGLSFASWRKTGMDYFSNILTPRKFKDHNRHDSFATTELYLPKRKRIDEISELKDNFFNRP